MSRIIKISGENFLVLPIIIEIDIEDNVQVNIDWERRYKYMRYHTAAHILMGAIKRNIKNYSPLGINIDEEDDRTKVKFEGNWDVSKKEAINFINISNNLIKKGNEINIKTYVKISEVINEYGELYRGPKELKLKGKLRVIVIENWDVNPCGGTHVKDLNEIGRISLVNYEDGSITFNLSSKKEEDEQIKVLFFLVL